MTTLPFDNRMEKLARDLREQLGVPDDLRLDAADLLRRAKLSKLIHDFELVSDEELPRDAARWSPDRVLKLRQRVLSAPDGDSIFTVAHELGHAVMHNDVRNRRADARSYQHGRNIEPDEHDADWFARTIIAPEYLAVQQEDLHPETISAVFGLPMTEAVIRSEELSRRRRKQLGIRRVPPSRYDPTKPGGDEDVEGEYGRYINAWAKIYKI